MCFRHFQTSEIGKIHTLASPPLNISGELVILFKGHKMASMTQKWPFSPSLSPRFSPFSLDFLVVTATIMKTCHLFMVSLLINVFWVLITKLNMSLVVML